MEEVFKNTSDIATFENDRNKILTRLSDDDEAAVVPYISWRGDRGLNIDNLVVKAIIRDIHSCAVTNGEKRKPINEIPGPSAKYMVVFYARHPETSRINMVSKDAIMQYLDLLTTILCFLTTKEINK